MNSTIANLKFDRVISSNNSIGDKLVAFTINNALAVTVSDYSQSLAYQSALY
jgi:hypothetical protein